MRKWRVVSAEGWGPGFSGANCTFRITRRTEFLGVRGYSLDTQTPTPTSHRGWGSWELDGMGKLQRGGFPHLLWLFSSRDLAQKARISKSTPQALGREKRSGLTQDPCCYHHPLPSLSLQSWAGTLAQFWSEEHSVLPSSSACSRPGTWQRLHLAVQCEPLYPGTYRSRAKTMVTCEQ